MSGNLVRLPRNQAIDEAPRGAPRRRAAGLVVLAGADGAHRVLPVRAPESSSPWRGSRCRTRRPRRTTPASSACPCWRRCSAPSPSRSSTASRRGRSRPWSRSAPCSSRSMIDYSGARTSPYAFFYIWLALYALFFFGRGQAVVQVLFIAFAYAAVVVGDVTSGGTGRPGRDRRGGAALDHDRRHAGGRGGAGGHAEGAPRRPGRALRGRCPGGSGDRPPKPARVRRELRAGGGARAARRSCADPAARRPRPLQDGQRPARPSARRRRAAPRRRDPARLEPAHRPGRPGRRRGVRRPAPRQRRARRAHRRRAHAPRDPRRLRRGPGAAHDQLRHRKLSPARGDHRGPDGERRPGPLHGEGDRARLLGDLRTGCAGAVCGTCPQAPRAAARPAC